MQKAPTREKGREQTIRSHFKKIFPNHKPTNVGLIALRREQFNLEWDVSL